MIYKIKYTNILLLKKNWGGGGGGNFSSARAPPLSLNKKKNVFSKTVYLKI